MASTHPHNGCSALTVRQPLSLHHLQLRASTSIHPYIHIITLHPTLADPDFKAIWPKIGTTSSSSSSSLDQVVLHNLLVATQPPAPHRIASPASECPALSRFECADSDSVGGRSAERSAVICHRASGVRRRGTQVGRLGPRLVKLRMRMVRGRRHAWW